MIIKYDSANVSYEKTYAVITDAQGSIMALYDTQGKIVYETSYDAWGRERSATDGSYTNVTVRPVWLIRGYTGHEHLPEFGLINMNGRLYDPQLARMLSPDNFVQDATSTQGFNRYSYVLNNPLKYKDPSGEFIPILIPIAIGVLAGGFAGYQIGKAEGATGWGSGLLWYALGGAGIGALTGGVAAGISAAGGGAIVAGMAAGSVGGAGFSGLATNWNGNAMIQGAFYGAISGGVGAGVGAAIGGGLGAFAGGAVGSGINTALYGGSLQDVGFAALAGGTMAFGIYHVSSYLSWQFGGGNKWGDLDISYRQYTAMQADFQRSRFWRIEYGGYLLEGGGVYRVDPGSNSQIDMGTAPEGAFAEYHTHWDEPGQVRYVIHGGNGNYVDPQEVARDTPVGQRVALDRFITSQYHGSWDLNTGGRPSFVINRYDASYYPGYGSYSPFNPPINRFVYSFYFWR